MEDFDNLSVEEIKKMTAGIIKKDNKKETFLKNIPKLFKNPIDKFTSTDELLKQNLISLRDLNEEQHITNQLLLNILFKTGTDGSIAPYQPNSIDTESILSGLKGGDDYQTLNPIMLNINGKDAGIRVEGSGIIDTIKFVSSTTTTDNKDYTVEVKCDKTILYNNTFAELEARTGTERGMVCYEDLLAFKYLLIFRTILYTNGFEIRVLNAKGKFEMFQVKYHKKV